MKKALYPSIIILIFILPILQFCKKQKVPILTTTEVTNITGTTATSGGTVTDEGSGTIVERGICWSNEITPTTDDNRTIEGGGAGAYTSTKNNQIK